tara:strand:- start:2595 stop:4112 length:1518 start_codon:yes stop_codon:yes gene_type:complete
MTDKIIFWLDAFLMNFCLATDLQKKHDSELFAIFDITNRTKKFFENQNLVKFQKQWFLHDYIEIKNSKPDTKYLEDFEKRYSINIWELGLNERIFYNYNNFYKFSHDEILSILEKECKLYENILDEVKPDFLITSETALHQQHLFYEICKKRGVKILMLHQSKLAYKCIISQELHKIDFMPDLDQIVSKNRSFDELLSKLKSFDTGKQTKFYASNFGKSKSSKLKALFEFAFKSNNSNIDTHFSYFGRTKSKVISKYLLYAFQTKSRKSFIDKNFESEIHHNEKFILFTLNQEPERSTLIATPYYTNQIEVIRHVAKSLPPGYKLYVKEHFSQELREWRKISYYKEILDIPNVRLYHPSADIEKLIQTSSLVISIGGTTPFQAPFYQKPSIIISDLGYAILPSVIKLKSLEELPETIRNTLNIKVNPVHLDRYLSILENNSFDFNFKEYEIMEGNFFRHGGNFHDVIITNEKMKSFLELNEKLIKIISEEHIKKIQQLKKLGNSS